MNIGRILAAGLAAAVIAAASLPAAETDKGAETMMLEGGRQGAVPFPHHRHQSVLGDCNLCHGVFPQESGAIARLKAAGQLKAKSDVMNKLCIKCHRAKKTAGEKSGPLTCTTCHQR
jgi:hypothetical protein